MSKIEQLIELLKGHSKDSFLRHALALEYVKSGNDVAAKQVFEELLRDNPQYIGSYYHLGKLLERQHNETAATIVYEQGMKAALEAGEKHLYSELRSAHELLKF